MPFPKAAHRVGDLVDRGFAVNGVASVLGATAAVLIAITQGFTVALLVALALYALAGFLDTALGNAPSIKMAEPDLIRAEEGANLIIVLNTQRLAEESRDLLELLVEHDLLVDMDRDKYDRRISPVLGLGGLFRPVSVSVFLDSDSMRGKVRVPFVEL